jgi:hypothetical protein
MALCGVVDPASARRHNHRHGGVTCFFARHNQHHLLLLRPTHSTTRAHRGLYSVCVDISLGFILQSLALFCSGTLDRCGLRAAVIAPRQWTVKISSKRCITALLYTSLYWRAHSCLPPVSPLLCLDGCSSALHRCLVSLSIPMLFEPGSRFQWTCNSIQLYCVFPHSLTS